ncbi:MAG: hypothetical protein QXF56_03790 [Candidatus Micrarchaeia archaeon]
MSDIKGWYKASAGFLFLFMALPSAAVLLIPNEITKTFYYPLTLLIVTFHELGHIILWLLVSPLQLSEKSALFLICCGGPLMQLFIPAIPIVYFTLVRKKYALAFIFLAFFGSSLYYLGGYMSTAAAPSGTGITPTGEIISIEKNPESHDFRLIFTQFGVLEHSAEISNFFISLGYVLTLIGAFSSALETNIILNGNETNDFMLVMLYGSAPAFLLSIVYFQPARFILSFVFFILSLAYFFTSIFPKMKESFEEVSNEEE